MLLNPYQFRRHLRTDALEPHGAGWGILVLAATGCVMAFFPLMAPTAVAMNLPHIQQVYSADHALLGSHLVIVNGETLIYRGRTLSRNSLIEQLQSSASKGERLLILASESTSLSEILPLINAAEKAGFSDVAFVVKP